MSDNKVKDSYEEFSNNLKKKHNINIKRQKRYFPKREFPFSYKYFENTYCEFFPCHSDAIHGHNCMFCKCPLYPLDDCPGVKNNDAIILDNGVKDCSNCEYPHEYANAEKMLRYK
jgi:Zn-finger protein